MPQPDACPSVVPTSKATVPQPDASDVIVLASHAIALPNANAPSNLDYIAYERGAARVWIPDGRTGSVDVFDTATGMFKVVGGFKSEEREGKDKGKKRWMGPSAVSIGDGFAYIGDRASNEVCPIDLKTLKPAACVKLAARTDGVVFVAASHEVWVTTPDDSSVVVLDASTPGLLKQKTTIKVAGQPEGYAVDEARGLFFTNLEDKGQTLAIEVATRKVKWTWSPSCGSDGPQGLVYDAAHVFVIVACTDHVQVLDAKDGHALGKLDIGADAKVDNLDLVGDRLYVAARSGKLTVAKIDDGGQLTITATGELAKGARNAVADDKGNVYVGDAQGAQLVIFESKR